MMRECVHMMVPASGWCTGVERIAAKQLLVQLLVEGMALLCACQHFCCWQGGSTCVAILLGVLAGMCFCWVVCVGPVLLVQLAVVQLACMFCLP